MAIARQKIDSVVPASGIGEIVFKPTRGQTWELQQVGVKAGSGAAGAIGEIFVDNDFITPFVPTGDAPSSPPYPVVGTNSRVRVRWTGATAGTSISATIIYDDGQGTR